MIVAGFFFAAVSAYLVGMIGSSNNPISGLTLSTVIVAAAPHGRARPDRHGRHRRGARRRRRDLRLGGGRRRNAAGPQGRAHPRRHPLEDAGRRSDRHRRRVGGDVLPDPGPPPGGHQGRRHGTGRSEPAGPAGQPHGARVPGHRRRRDGVAADRRRHPDGRRLHPRAGAQPDARLRRDVSAARNHLRHLRRRRDPRRGGQDGGRKAVQRRAESQGGEQRSAHAPPG